MLQNFTSCLIKNYFSELTGNGIDFAFLNDGIRQFNLFSLTRDFYSFDLLSIDHDARAVYMKEKNRGKDDCCIGCCPCHIASSFSRVLTTIIFCIRQDSAGASQADSEESGEKGREQRKKRERERLSALFQEEILK